MKTLFYLLLSLGFSLMLKAQMPSECLLIINGRSLQAMEVAHTYAALRKFPAERILVLYPDTAFFRQPDGSPRWQVSAAEARQQLLAPVLEKLMVLADPFPATLILSPEWPTRVNVQDSPPVSITAFLGTRGDLPAAELIKNGQAISPWFSAPPDTGSKGPGLLRYPFHPGGGPALHPAAMLGVYYPPQTTEKMIAQLKNAVSGDYRQPVGSILFETNADVRTRTRLSQYQQAMRRLEDKQVKTVMMPRSDSPPDRIIGVMAGAPTIDARKYAPGLTPGSFADHLTSFAATFDNPHQSKLTLWLEAGAAASYGTVTEPFAIWTKFPEAALFERYLRGNTLLEALMQSIASPYQGLIVGDPLCRPWARALEDLKLRHVWTEGVLEVEVEGLPMGSATTLHLFADGRRLAGDGPRWRVETTPESHGPEMDLLLHARYQWAPPQVGVLQKRIDTPYPERLQVKASVKPDHVALKIKSAEDLMLIELFRGTEKVHTAPVSGKKAELSLGLNRSGTGPVQIRVRGVSRSGEILYGNLVEISPIAP